MNMSKMSDNSNYLTVKFNDIQEKGYSLNYKDYIKKCNFDITCIHLRCTHTYLYYYRKIATGSPNIQYLVHN